MPTPASSTFSLTVTLGYGVDPKTEEALNKACSAPKQQSLTELASQYFFPDDINTKPKAASKKRENENTSKILQDEAFFVASASNVQLTMDEAPASDMSSLFKAAMSGATIHTTTSTGGSATVGTNQVAIFVPPHIMASCLERHFAESVDSQEEAKKETSISQRGSSFWINPPVDAQRFAQDLVCKVMPQDVLATSSSHSQSPLIVIKGIILTNLAANSPADMMLLQVAHSSLQDLLLHTNGVSLAADKTCILKVLPVTSVKFVNGDSTASQSRKKTSNNTIGVKLASTTKSKAPLLPTCPVCIHRIDPIRLGLPAPTNQHICSRFCPSPLGNWGTGTSASSSSLFASHDDSCSKQKFLNPWPIPARCKPCQVIQEYWDFDKAREHHPRSHRNSIHEHMDLDGDLFCEECSMHKTLWTCLTCGFVGCGRYSNKHSVAHFEQTRHPYSLELATLRVWDYCHGQYGGFVQRPDLLECPSSPPLAHPWMIRGLERLDDSSGSSYHGSRLGGMNATQSALMGEAPSRIPEVEKSSKKVGMIGDEYEALLQSALEDQAQHYEGEMTKLRAELTTALVDKTSMSPEEAKEIDGLKADVAKAQKEIEAASKELLEAQAQEAGLRAESQQLLSEQQKADEILKKIQAEHQRENEQGKLQIGDLEQQVADLSANLRMRQQFSQSDELSHAQIFGTTSAPDTKPAGNRRGKKKGRSSRK